MHSLDAELCVSGSVSTRRVCVCVCVCVCATWEFGKPNKSRCSPTVIRACEIVPLKMLWSECVCVCVCGLCGPSLLSLFRILGNEKAASWFPGACSLRPPFRCFFFASSSSLCLLLIPHNSLPPCAALLWSPVKYIYKVTEFFFLQGSWSCAECFHHHFNQNFYTNVAF